MTTVVKNTVAHFSTDQTPMELPMEFPEVKQQPAPDPDPDPDPEPQEHTLKMSWDHPVPPPLNEYIKGYIESRDVNDVITVAIATGQNVLLWGPPGYGKSEMTQAFFKYYKPEASVYTMSFGDGMEEAALYGGLDFNALSKSGKLEYFPENSFLNYDFAVFEELFDAPTPVLLSLKDTLTARELRKGTQRFPMKTKAIIGITNKCPEDIATMGDSERALIERFPLVLRVDWEEFCKVEKLAEFGKFKFPDLWKTLSHSDNRTFQLFLELLAKSEGANPRIFYQALSVIQNLEPCGESLRFLCKAFSQVLEGDPLEEMQTFEQYKMDKALVDAVGYQLEDYGKQLESLDSANKELHMVSQLINDIKNILEVVQQVYVSMSVVEALLPMVQELQKEKDRLIKECEKRIKEVKSWATKELGL